MSKSYTECPRDIKQLAEAIIDKYHPDIEKHGVTITYTFVKSSDEDKPALTHGGHASAALCKINGEQERMEGLTDCSISIDERLWEDYTDDERNALLDHELHHITVVRDKDGGAKTDGCNRPKVRLRKHDIVVGGFHVIVKRHGIAALEAQHVRDAAKVFKQHEFTFMDELESVS